MHHNRPQTFRAWPLPARFPRADKARHIAVDVGAPSLVDARIRGAYRSGQILGRRLIAFWRAGAQHRIAPKPHKNLVLNQLVMSGAALGGDAVSGACVGYGWRALARVVL